MKCNYAPCNNKQYAKGLCSGHYTQQRSGKPLRPLRKRVIAYQDEGGRACTTCGHYKPWVDFYDHRSRCKPCLIREILERRRTKLKEVSA